MSSDILLKTDNRLARDAGPWWRESYCWLVIVGPLTVVIAGFITMFMAYHGGDTLSPVYVADHRVVVVNKRAAESLQPAQSARNGAALGRSIDVPLAGAKQNKP